MRAMIKLEITLDVDTVAGMRVLSQVLSESPGARLQLRHSMAAAVEGVLSEWGKLQSVVTVNTATARAYVAAGERRRTAKQRRRIESPKGGSEFRCHNSCDFSGDVVSGEVTTEKGESDNER